MLIHTGLSSGEGHFFGTVRPPNLSTKDVVLVQKVVVVKTTISFAALINVVKYDTAD